MSVPGFLLNLAQVRVEAKDHDLKHLGSQSTVQMLVSSTTHLMPCSLHSHQLLRSPA